MSINESDPIAEPIVEEVIPSEGADPVAAEEVDGQVEAADLSTETPLEPKYLDLNEYEDHLVRVKINGEDVELPANELPQGYMRHADYTQKTQEIAFWRQVDTAMRNPETAGHALQYLAQTFGVETAQAVADQHQEQDEEEYADPIERRLSEIENQARQANDYVSQQQAVAYLNQVTSGLSQKYGDFNAQEVVAAAIEQGISDPGRLEEVYKLMQFDRMRAATAAQQTVAEQRTAGDAARRAAAQQAAAVTGGASSASGVSTAAPASSNARPRSVREAFEQAKAELAAA